MCLTYRTKYTNRNKHTGPIPFFNRQMYSSAHRQSVTNTNSHTLPSKKIHKHTHTHSPSLSHSLSLTHTHQISSDPLKILFHQCDIPSIDRIFLMRIEASGYEYHVRLEGHKARKYLISERAMKMKCRIK